MADVIRIVCSYIEPSHLPPFALSMHLFTCLFVGTKDV